MLKGAAAAFIAAMALLWWPTPAVATQDWICGSAPTGWVLGEPPEESGFNRISIVGADELRWNGGLTDRDELWEYLGFAAAAAPETLTLLEFGAEADCSLVQEVRNRMTRELRCSEGFCGEWRPRSRSAGPPSTETEIQRRLEEAEADLRRALEEADAATRQEPR